MLRELSAQVDDLVESDEEANDNTNVDSHPNSHRSHRSLHSQATNIHEYSDPSIVSAQVNRPTTHFGLLTDPLSGLRARTHSDCLHPALSIADPAVVGAVAAPPSSQFLTSYPQTVAFSSLPPAFTNAGAANLEDPAIISAVSSGVATVQVSFYWLHF